MKDGTITDSQISSSSFWNNHPAHAPQTARLDKRANGWVSMPGEYKIGGWIQIDFLTPAQVTGVITQGRGPSSSYEQWVETYEILYGDDESNLSTVSNWGRGASNIVFQGNSDRYTKVTNFFPDPIT